MGSLLQHAGSFFFVAACGLFTAVHGLLPSRGVGTLEHVGSLVVECRLQSAQTQELQHVGSLIVALRL